MTNLTRLTISGLRGISQPLEINFEKSLTLIYGENGTGKTSICDALDLLGNETCGSLVDVSIGSGKHRFWPFIGQRDRDISIVLEAADGTHWRASIVGGNVNVTSSSQRQRPIVKVWRRKQLIDLILAKPADRFRVIASFIDVSAIETSENAIRDLQKNINRELEEAGIRLAESLETLEAQKRLGSVDGNVDTVQWARGEIAKPVESLDQELSALGELIQTITVVVTAIQQLSELRVELDKAIEAESTALDSFDTIKRKTGEIDEETVNILQSASNFFHDHTTQESCPLCESAENITDLPKKVEQKLSSLAEFSAAKTSKENATTKRQNSENQVERAEARFQGQITALKEKRQKLESFQVSTQILATFLGENGDDKVYEDADILNLAHVALEQRRTELSEQKGRRDSLDAALKQYDQNISSQNDNNTLKPKIDRLLEIHETQRKGYIDNVLTSIADGVGRLYEAIHPGEGLNQIALQLDPNRRSSLDIQSQFMQQTVHPGAYFSNSHLDSLGLCILIALAKRESAENTILVMDDILGSIDEPHVDRMVQLLYAESQHFLHTLVTTHYQAWHWKIRRGQLRNAECQVIELDKWSHLSGVKTRPAARPLLENLRISVQNHPNEGEPIAAFGGHLLEQICDFLTSHYECSVQRKRDGAGNTLNDYLNGLKKNLLDQILVEVRQGDGAYTNVQLGPLFEEIKDIYQVRNAAGAHYNELAAHLPQGDIVRFGELVIEIGDALICSLNGIKYKHRQNHDYWSTTNETRRLYPLQRP